LRSRVIMTNGMQGHEPGVKESMEVQVYDATPLMIEQYSKLRIQHHKGMG
jgi:hypothetical protein